MIIEKHQNLNSRIRFNQNNESSGRFFSPVNPLDVTLRALDLNILCHYVTRRIFGGSTEISVDFNGMCLCLKGEFYKQFPTSVSQYEKISIFEVRKIT